MKVKIGIEFEVDAEVGNEDEFGEIVAAAAASAAAYDYLSFCTVSGVNTDTEEVKVHVDGHGEFIVRIGENHD